MSLKIYYFYGNTGLGKTFFCNCIAKEILEKGKTVLYATAPQFLKLWSQFDLTKLMKIKMSTMK